MKRTLLSLFVGVLAVTLIADDTLARGGRGGGGRRGGGGFSRGGGGRGSFGGGGARRSPSMSRPSYRPSTRPSMGNRPSTRPSTRPGTGNRPSIRPGTGNRPGIGNRPTTRPGTGNRPGNFPGSGAKPNRNDLGNFLNLPGGGRPSTRPSNPNRPNVGNNIGNRTNIGNKNTKIGRGPTRNNININQYNANRTRVGTNVRGHWHGRHVNAFNRAWFVGRPGWGGRHWHYHAGWGRYPAHYFWRRATAIAVTGWFVNWWKTPAYYNYGQNIYYQDNSVYYGDQKVASAGEYYEQASTLANSAPEIKEETQEEDKTEWMPLGVFALTQPDSGKSNMILQLAVSKKGIIAGTFYNETTDTTHPVEGMVDKKNQRASWHFTDGKNPDLVMETGIFNLTKDETEALIHFNKEKTQSILMVRLPDPENDKKK